jgi:uracil-DNA glycosylase
MAGTRGGIDQTQIDRGTRATAARAVFGRTTAIEVNRGRILKLTGDEKRGLAYAGDALVTIHPSFLLRMPPEDKDAAFERFVADLKLSKKYA